MVEVAHRPRPGQERLQQALPLDEGQRAQVEALEAEEVEGEVGGRRLEGAPLDVGGPALLRPPLQPLEARAALVVQDHDLAVEDEVAERQGGHRPRHLRVEGRRVAPAAVDELRPPALAAGEDAEAVVLELEQPRGVRERLLRRLREHERHVGGPDLLPRRPEPLELALLAPAALWLPVRISSSVRPE